MLDNVFYERIVVSREIGKKNIKTKGAIIYMVINGVAHQIFEKDVEKINRHIDNFCRQKKMSPYALEKEGSLAYLIDDKQKTRSSNSYKRTQGNASYFVQKLKGNIDSTIANFKRPSYLKSLSKKALVVVAAGVITIGSINALNNYKLKHDNIYNNKHVSLSVFSPDESKIEGDLYNVLASYNEFDDMMISLVNGEWDNIDDKNLNDFFEDLDIILQANYGYIADKYEQKGYNPDGYDRKDKFKRPIYSINLESYFKNNSIDYCAVKNFQWQSDFANLVNMDISSYSSLKNEMKKYLNKVIGFVMDNQVLSGHDANHNDVYYSFNQLSPMAKYIIVETARTYLELYNFDETYIYRNSSTYVTFTEKQVLERFNSLIDGVKEQMKNNVDVSSRSNKTM